MKKYVLVLFVIALSQMLVAQIGINQSNNGIGTSKMSMGMGIGVDYGGFGINTEIRTSNKLAVTVGFGTMLDYGLGYSFGTRYYLRGQNQTWQPRISVLYGTNVAAIEEYYDYYDYYTEYKLYSGLDIGIGQKWAWGRTKKHGMNFDLLFIITSSAPEYMELPVMDISVGYIYNF